MSNTEYSHQNKKHKNNNPKFKKTKYLILGFIFWFVIDWGTAGGFHLKYYKNIWRPAIIVYSLYPLIFSYLIFKFNLRGRILFLITSLTGILSEIFLFKNTRLIQFPHFILFIPLAVFIYSFIIFTPMWLVIGEAKNNKKKILSMFILFLAISILSIFTQK